MKGFEGLETENRVLQSRISEIQRERESMGRENIQLRGSIKEWEEKKKGMENRVYLLQTENDRLVKQQGEWEQKQIGLQREINRMEE